MLEGMSIIEMVKLFSPLIALQFGLAAYCAVIIFRKGVRNFNKIVWLIIVLFANLLGPVSFLLFGRKRWEDD
jgi:hypothetical protein